MKKKIGKKEVLWYNSHIDLRTVGREGLKQIRRQVVRLKKMGKTDKEIGETQAFTKAIRPV